MASSATHALSDAKPSRDAGDGAVREEKSTSAGSEARSSEDVSGVVQQMNSLSVTQSKAAVPQEEKKASQADLEKRIRALRKKVRFLRDLVWHCAR